MDHPQHLITKLGYQPDEAVDTVDAPEWFLEYLRGNGVHTHAKLPAEWLHLFMTNPVQLEHFMRHLKLNEIQKGLWISWPSPNSSIPHNMTEQRVRDCIAPYGWVAITSCSIDETWEALLFTRQQD